MSLLREERKRRGVMAKAVARYLGVTERTYYNYEKNPQSMKIETALKVCEFLNCSIDDIFLAE